MADLGIRVVLIGDETGKASLISLGETGDASAKKVEAAFNQTAQAVQQMSATSRAAFESLSAEQQKLYQQFISGTAATQRATQATAQLGDTFTRVAAPAVTFRREIEQTSAALTRMSAPAVTGFRQMADAQDAAAKSSGVHGLQLGRVNNELGTFIGRLTGSNTAVTRLTAQLGGAVAGYGAMIAILGGVALAITAIEKLAGYNSKAREEQDRLTKSLEDWYKAEQNGAAGERARQIEAEVAALQKLNDQYVKLKQNAPAPTIGGEGGATIDIGAIIAPADEKKIREKGDAALAAQKEVTAKMEAQQVSELSNLISHNRATEQERERAANTLQFLQSRLREGLNLEGTGTATLGERSQLVSWIDDLDKALNPQKVAQLTDRLKSVSESVARFLEQANGMGKELSVDQRVQGYVDQLSAVGRVLDDDVARHKISRDEYAKQSAEVVRLTQAVRDAGDAIKQSYSDQLTKNLQDQFNAQHQLNEDWAAGIGSLRELTAAKQAQNEIDRTAVQLGHDLTDQQKQLIRGRYDDAAALAGEQQVYNNILETIRKLTPESMDATLRTIRDNQAKSQEEFYSIWAKGFERITDNGLKDFQSFARDVLSLFQDLIRHMQQEGEEGVKIKILGYATAGIAGYTSGYQTGQSIGSTGLGGLGGAASGALTGAAIGSGIAPGIGTAIGAAIGGFTGLIGGLLGGAAAARERAKAEQQLRDSLTVSTAQIKNQLGLMSNLDLAQTQARAQFDKQAADINAAYSGKKNEQERNTLLQQNLALEQQYLDLLRQQDAIAKQQQKEDLQVRLLRAQGNGSAADALQLQLQQERERDALIKSFGDTIDPTEAATLALLDQVQAQEKLAASSHKVAAGFLNIDDGLKVMADRFHAIAPANSYTVSGFGPTLSPPASPPVSSTSTSTPSAQGSPATFVLQVDGRELGRIVVKNLQRTSSRTNGTTVDWSKVSAN
jgi:hypothetical protein